MALSFFYSQSEENNSRSWRVEVEVAFLHLFLFLFFALLPFSPSKKRKLKTLLAHSPAVVPPRARKIFSVPVAEMSQVPFFWSHFLSSWSQSCTKTQKLRRKKKRSHLWGHLLHTPGHEHHQWNDRKRKEKKRKLLERSWVHFILMKPWEEGVGAVE